MVESAVPSYILDASVAAKWILKDESYANQALALLEDYRLGHVNLLAPDHIYYEVASAVRNAVRMRRLNENAGRDAIEDFQALRISTISQEFLLRRAFAISILTDCSLYDGLYLAASVLFKRDLIYADNRLRNTLRNKPDAAFGSAIWIEDYQSPIPPTSGE